LKRIYPFSNLMRPALGITAAVAFWTVHSAAWGNDAILPGDLIVEPATLQCVGFEWEIDGDDNRNATVAVIYKTGWFGKWKQALPLLRIKGEVVDREGKAYTCGNLFAGSILDLQPDTAYKVKLTMTDPDGGGSEKVVAVKTRPIPMAFSGGHKLHLYPRESISSLKAGGGLFFDFKDAYAAAVPGDTIVVHAGVHRVASPHEKGQTDFLLSKPATAQRPIVIRGAGDGEAIFNGVGNQLFRLAGADYHYFEGLTLRDADQLIHAGRGEEHCVGLVVRGCRLEQSMFPIWALSGQCRDFYIADNVIVGPAEQWSPRDESNKKYGASHAIWLQGQGHVVCHNKISRFWDGIDLTGGAPTTKRSEQNSAIDFYNNEISECIDDAIEMDYGVHNIRVYRNFIYNVFMGISAQPVYGGPGYILRNVVFNSTRQPVKLNCYPAGLLIYHNTFLCMSGFQNAPIWQNTHLRNNLFLGRDGGGDGYIWTGTPTPQTSTMDYNGYRTKGFTRERPIWWRFAEPTKVPTTSRPSMEGTFSNLVEFTAITGYEKHAVVVDYDIFVKAGPPTGESKSLPPLDLRLREGSVAVDVGKVLPDINDGFTGKAPDLGAYEVGEAIPHYGPRLSDR